MRQTHNNSWKWTLFILAAVFAVIVARAVNLCMEYGPHYLPWTCVKSGSVTSPGALDWTNLHVCIGQVVAEPAFTNAPVFANGQKRRWVYYDCPPPNSGYQTSAVYYAAGSLYFASNSPGSPPITGPFNSPGVYTYTAKVDGVPRSIAGWWKAETDTLDAIFNRAGTQVGGLCYTSGIVGQAFTFNGYKTAVQLGNPMELQLTNFTIEGWVKRNNLSMTTLVGPWGMILSYGDRGYGFGLAYDGRLFLMKVGSELPVLYSSRQVTNLNWHHLAVSKNNSTVKFYIDGSCCSTGLFTESLQCDTSLAIGARGDDYSYSFLGSIDELAVYACPLQDSEITAIYNANTAGKGLGGVASGWPLLPQDCTCGRTNITVATVTVTVEACPPQIVNQPLDQIATQGDSVTFSVGATGSPPLSYQWNFNGNNLVGATTSVLTLSNVLTAQAGTYAVLVTNLYGSLLSSNAVLTVSVIPPSIIVQPVGQTVAAGSSVSFFVQASGSPPLSYQWRRDGVDLNGATSSSLLLTDVQPADQGGYSVVVSNVNADPPSATSLNAVLVVMSSPSCAVAPYLAMVGWWRAEGDATDCAGGNTGTLVGSATYGSGAVGQGFLFASDGDCVRLANSPNLQLQDFTIEAWIQRANATLATTTASGSAGYLFGFPLPGYAFGLYNDGRLVLTTNFWTENGGVAMSSGVINNTAFHHVAVTKSGSTVIFYVDGTAYPAPGFDPGFTFPGAPLIGAVEDFGWHPDQPTFGFWGTIDELSFYNRALSASEIQSINNAGANGQCVILDSDSNGLPDAWERWYFGRIGIDPNADYDNDGLNNLQEYSGAKDPNEIRFSLSVTNPYVKNSQVSIQPDILGGVPFSMAILVDSTNFGAAIWTNYHPNPTVNLGSGEGWHEVWVGLRALNGGLHGGSLEAWASARLKLDRTPPLLVITNPASSTVMQPVIQVQGFCPEPLATLSYDLANAAGSVTGQSLWVLDQSYETNTWEFTTNVFQAFDVPLTEGANTLTLHATDRAGNSTNATLTFTLNYSSKTNPPTVELFWPQDGLKVSGSTFTWRGRVEDATARLQVTVTNEAGNGSISAAPVDRSGYFWATNLPLSPGTNYLALTATDVVGNVTVSNITVVKSDVNLTIDPVLGDQLSKYRVHVTGTIDSPDYVVWVNGVQATPTGGDAWEANYVPTTPGGTAVFVARAIPKSDHGGAGTGGSGGAWTSYADPGNPQSAGARDTECETDKPPLVFADRYNRTEFESDHSRIDDESGAWDLAYDQRHYGCSWTHDSGGSENTAADGAETNTFEGWHTFSEIYHDFSLWSDATNWRTMDDVWVEDDVTYGPYFYGPDPGGPFSAPREHVVVCLTDSEAYGTTGQNKHSMQISHGADTVMKLRTGGKPGSSKANLFCITAGATHIWWGVPLHAEHWLSFIVDIQQTNWPVKPTDITVLGKRLNSDGNLYVTLPDNEEFDVTPKVDLPYYTFSIDATKSGNVDLDVDSNNDGAIDEDDDPIEDQPPGKYVPVNGGDQDGDGIPDFADGYDKFGTPDASGQSASFTPMTLSIPVDLTKAKVRFTFSESDPNAVEQHTDSSGTYYTPGDGGIRIWAKDGNQYRKKAEIDHYTTVHGYLEQDGNRIRAGREYWATNLTSLYVEGIHPGTYSIKVGLDPDGQSGFITSDQVTVTVIGLDLDIDSDNNNGFGPPDRSATEDRLEDAPDEPGKIIWVHRDDADDDGIPDYVDGFDLDPSLPADDLISADDHFVPVVLELKPLPTLPDGRIRINYNGSAPADVTYDDQSYPPQWNLPGGSLRLWLKDANLARNKNSANGLDSQGQAVTPGDYVAPGTYTLSQLGLSSGNETITLYLEGVAAASSETISVEYDPDGDGLEAAIVMDSVRVTVIDPKLEYVAFDSETGMEQPVDPVEYHSDPRPEVSMQVVDGPYLDSWGNLVVSVAGTVSDRLSDLGTPSEQVQQLQFTCNGQAIETPIGLPALVAAGSSWPWRPSIFEVNFQRTLVLPFCGGRGFLIRAETSPNAAGASGWSEISIPVSWQIVSPFYPATSDLAGDGSGPALTPGDAPLALAFNSAPSPDAIDSARIYFGNRASTGSDPVITETSANSWAFHGSLRTSPTNLVPVDVSIPGGFTYVNEAVNQFVAQVSYTVGTNVYSFTGSWQETGVGTRLFLHGTFTAVSSAPGYMVIGSEASTVTFYAPGVDSTEEIGGGIPGEFKPMLLRITGLEDTLADRFSIKINGVDQSLITLPGHPNEYYVADPQHSGFPRVYVNAPGLTIPGVTPPGLTLDDELPAQKTFNIELRCADTGTSIGGSMAAAGGSSSIARRWRGNVLNGGTRLAPHPPVPTGPFTTAELLACFDWYNEFMLANQTPPCGFGTYKLYYGRLKDHFLGKTGNSIVTESLTFGGYWYGDKAKIRGSLLDPRTIVIDNVHQTVWEGVFHLQELLDGKEAKANSDWTIADEEPEQSMDMWLYQNRVQAVVSQSAKYARYGSELEMMVYTTLLPGGQIASDIQQLYEGNVLVGLRIIKKVPGVNKTISGSGGRYVVSRASQQTGNPIWGLIPGYQRTPIPKGSTPYKFLMSKIKAMGNGGEFVTASGQAVFYSGKFDGSVLPNWQLAKVYAQNTGKKAIDMTTAGNWLLNEIEANKALGQLTRKQESQLWAAASHYFAKGASGEVTAFVRGAKPESVFARIEFDRLLKNPNTTILTVLPAEAP